jgi:hypothetical protein
MFSKKTFVMLQFGNAKFHLMLGADFFFSFHFMSCAAGAEGSDRRDADL